MHNPDLLNACLARLPLVAILRGLTPPEAPAIGEVLAEVGFTLIEVPLNSPQALRSITLLARAHPQLLVGAGTVMSVDEVRAVHAAGGRLIVSPHFDPEVVRSAVELGLACLPGVLTPSEIFAALAAGAHGLKLFPAEMAGPAVVKALRAVVPAAVPLLPVGGISTDNMPAYAEAGASGFGIGSALYQPGRSPLDVEARARAFAAAARQLRPV